MSDIKEINWFIQFFQDDKGQMSSARLLSVWGYALVTLMVIAELFFGKTTVIQGELYLTLIGVSAGGKLASKGLEKTTKL